MPCPYTSAPRAEPGTRKKTTTCGGFAAPFPFSHQGAAARGNLYVAELQSGTIRKITPAGVVTTALGVAGQIGVRLGSNGRLARVSGLSLSDDHTLIVVSANAVLVLALP